MLRKNCYSLFDTLWFNFYLKAKRIISVARKTWKNWKGKLSRSRMHLEWRWCIFLLTAIIARVLNGCTDRKLKNTCACNSMTHDNHLPLTHWGPVTHICVSKQTIIGSDNGLSPGRRQAIIWTNAGILLIGTLGTNFSEILIKILIFSFKKMGLKVSSAKWRPFCLGLNVLALAIHQVFGYFHQIDCADSHISNGSCCFVRKCVKRQYCNYKEIFVFNFRL